MSASLVLGIKVVPNEYKRVKLDNIDLDMNVSLLRDHALKNTIDGENTSIDLIFGGNILRDDFTISSYGIKSGFTVHVVKRVIAREIPPIDKPTKEQLHNVMKYWMLDYHNRTSIQKVYCSEVLKNIIANHPELRDDPASLAYLKDLELLFALTDPEVFYRLIDEHPILFKPLAELTAELIKEPGSTQASTSTGYSYSLEALSDEEEEAGEESRGHPLARNSSFNAITAAQLAAAIENAQTNFTSTGQVISNTSSGNRPRSSSSSRNIITSEMFGSALQQAFGTGSTGGRDESSNSNSAATPATGEESLLNIRTRLMPQLRQMQEMGLLNEAQNLRALQATNGDVQAAVELVFNGVVE